MNPSEMTDDELNQAIAEIVAKQNGWEVWEGTHGPVFRDAGIYLQHAPNYSGDVAAALWLLNGFSNWAIFYSDGDNPITPHGEKRGFSVLIPGKSKEALDLAKYSADSEFLPRAISEAAYMAIKGENQ